MLRALLQVIVPLFQLVPYSQDSFTFQLMVFIIREPIPVNGHDIWAAGPKADF